MVEEFNADTCKDLTAKLEFALVNNDVTRIFIIGHTHCGAAKGIVTGIEDEYLTPWLDVAKPALEIADAKSSNEEERLHNLEEEMVKLSYKNLLTYPPVQKALAENRLEIHVLIFDMDPPGQLLQLDEASGDFVPVNNAPPNNSPANNSPSP